MGGGIEAELAMVSMCHYHRGMSYINREEYPSIVLRWISDYIWEDTIEQTNEAAKTVWQDTKSMALFSSLQKPKIFQDFMLYRIFRYMHEASNINENKN